MLQRWLFTDTGKYRFEFKSNCLHRIFKATSVNPCHVTNKPIFCISMMSVYQHCVRNLTQPHFITTTHCTHPTASFYMANRNKTNDYDTATHATSCSGASYYLSSGAPVSNVNIDASMAGMVEAQQEKIRQLQQQLTEANCAKYKTTSSNEGRGKNIVCISKKVSTTATDQTNQQTDASYIGEAVWPLNKMLPKKWSQWREERNSMCQMILHKVATPVGVDKRSYWESMILGITNDKFCALQGNFKLELFE